MERRRLLLTAAAAAVAAATGAARGLAQPWDHHHDHDHHDEWFGHGDRDWHDEHGWHADHDRYWRPHYGERRYIDRDRVFWQLRRHNFTRFVGDPYWFHGRYVVRSYDRWGNLVFVEIDPYTGDFLGVVRF